MSVITPSQCHLWQKQNLSMSDVNLKDGFTRLTTFEDESHLIRSILQCTDCGQLYFYEFYEVIDWEHGNDPQYRTLIPVTSSEDAEQLNKLPPVELLQVFPRLQIDWPSDSSSPAAKWIDR